MTAQYLFQKSQVILFELSYDTEKTAPMENFQMDPILFLGHKYKSSFSILLFMYWRRHQIVTSQSKVSA